MKALKCGRCGKHAVTTAGVSGYDARQQYYCGHCGHSYNNGATAAGVTTREMRSSRAKEAT